jgi:hypothetical protein
MSIKKAFFKTFFTIILVSIAFAECQGNGKSQGKSIDSIAKQVVLDDAIDIADNVLDSRTCPVGTVFVKGGTFTMGCDDKRDGESFCENHFTFKPAHRVTVSDFCMGATLVKPREWYDIMDTNIGVKIGDNNLLIVDWIDADEYTYKLSQRTGIKYRMLTEAEWEYVARGDMRSEFGLCDTSDNIWEWVSDWHGLYDDDEEVDPIGPGFAGYANDHVIRGGNIDTKKPPCQVYSRNSGNHMARHAFRIAVSLTVPKMGDSDKAKIVETLENFYNLYVTENFSVFKDVNILKNEYFTKEFFDKLNVAKLDYDPVLNAQDRDISWMKTLEINPIADQENAYRVCYKKNTICATLFIVKTNGRYLINDIEGL